MIGAVGKVPVTVPGTPVPAYGTLSAREYNQGVHGVMFQALPANVGLVYIGASNMNKSTLVGVYAVLAIPTTNSKPSFSVAQTISPNGLSLKEFFIDADQAGEGALVTFLRV